jgi:hypothetical protein
MNAGLSIDGHGDRCMAQVRASLLIRLTRENADNRWETKSQMVIVPENARHCRPRIADTPIFNPQWCNCESQ